METAELGILRGSWDPPPMEIYVILYRSLYFDYIEAQEASICVSNKPNKIPDLPPILQRTNPR